MKPVFEGLRVWREAYSELVDKRSNVEAQRGFCSLHSALLEQRVRFHQHAVDHDAFGENAATFLQETPFIYIWKKKTTTTEYEM